jgi:type VI secretion system secreted protein VgrG
VQYRESDFNFISRLMEREGIYYYFRHGKNRHELVLVDAPDSHAPCPAQHQFRFATDEHGDGGNFDPVVEWHARRRIETGTVSLADHDWLKPATSLLVTTKSGDKGRPAKLEVYDYPCHYTEKAEGERYAEVRLQEQGARLMQAQGAGPLRSMAVGFNFELSKHPQPAENGKYLAVATVFELDNSSYFSGEGESRIDCRFIAIPAAQHYGSESQAVRTRVAGLQTAVVVGPAGEEIYTDEHGRVKVQFHWDRIGKRDENSSCWVRVATPWAGAMRGWVSVPRIGDEVVVDFLEGDPDRPMIIGSVYNGAQKPPWELPANRTQSGLLTRSSKGGTGQANANVLRFEDKKGSEQVWLHAEKDQLIEVEHDEDHTVGHDRRKSVGQDETTDVGRNRTETVGKDETISIGANRTEDVGKNESITIGDNRSESVGKNESIDIGKNRDETVGDNETVSIGKNREHKIGKDEKHEVGENRSTQIGKDDKLQVGKKLYIEAGDEITLVTGSASISMKKDGTIQIKGKDITVTGSGKIGIKASSDVVIKGSKIAEN